MRSTVPLVPLAPTVALVPLFQLFHSFHSPGTLPATHSFRLQCEWRTAELAIGASGAGDFNSSPPSLVQSHCSGGADESMFSSFHSLHSSYALPVPLVPAA